MTLEECKRRFVKEYLGVIADENDEIYFHITPEETYQISEVTWDTEPAKLEVHINNKSYNLYNYGFDLQTFLIELFEGKQKDDPICKTCRGTGVVFPWDTGDAERCPTCN